MEFIFEHEQLRIDEILRRINGKNSFTPLKPLRSMNLTMRRNSISNDEKGKNYLDSNKKCKIKSISPVLGKGFDSGWKQRTFIEFTKLKTPRVDQVQADRANKAKVLPDIGKRKHYVDKGYKKNSQNFIAYIPTVSFMNS